MARYIPRSVSLASEAPIQLYKTFDDFFNGVPSALAPRETFKVDVSETDDGYLVEADVPGVQKDQLDITLEDGKLTIAVNYSEEKDEEEKNYIHHERVQYSMSRSCYLSDADPDNIKATLADGVLSIDIPKAAPVSNAHKISVD